MSLMNQRTLFALLRARRCILAEVSLKTLVGLAADLRGFSYAFGITLNHRQLRVQYTAMQSRCSYIPQILTPCTLTMAFVRSYSPASLMDD